MRLSMLAVLVFAFMTFLGAFRLAAEDIVYPPEAGWANLKEKYGAKGDGVTDDTAAFKQMFADRRQGKVSRLYIPNGTYLISEPVGIFGGKAHSNDRFLRVQGQSEAGTVIKVKDNAPAFGDPKKPGIAFCYYQGQSTGDVMHSYVSNLTVDTGKGNPGAVGLRFMSNNTGALEHVTIRSGDGSGLIGLDMRQGQNGPNMVKHITVEGFATGVACGGTFSLVFEHITVNGAKTAGFSVGNARMTLRDFKCRGEGPGLITDKHGQVTLLKAMFDGTGAAETAIVPGSKKIFLRDIQVRGYAHTVKPKDGEYIDGAIDEWHDDKGQSLFGAKPKTLRLPVEETPVVPWENDPAKWIIIKGDKEDVSDKLQQAIDEGVAAGKTTICFVGNKQKITKPIRVHGSINRILGNHGLLDVADPNEAFKDDKAALFTFENLTSDVLIVEKFFLLGGWDAPNHVTMFANKSGKTIVVKNVNQRGQTKFPDPGGRWFFEDFSPGRSATMRIGKDEKVWLRQFNPESPKAEMMAVDGGQVWMLGLKTEGRASHLVAKNGAKVEILGGVSYQSWKNQPLDPPLATIVDSDVSLTFGFYHHKTPFTTIVEETFGGETKTLLRKDLEGYHLPVYRSGKEE